MSAVNPIQLGIFLLVAAAFPLSAAETAYQALGVVRAKLTASGLKNVTEVTGDRGGDQPQSWKILMNDPEARGGVREIVVSKGEIISERTPLTGFSGSGSLPVVDLTKLNLDSDKAFNLANESAQKSGTGFHWVNYTLRTDVKTGSPLWVLELIDYMGAPVGTIYISAQTGQITKGLQLETSRAAATQASTSETETKPVGGAIGEVEKFTKRTATNVKDGTLRVVGNVQEWLTGERTIGPPADE